jgi:hypothetical protein
MLDAVAGKFTVKDLGHDFEHQVLISMCMVVVSAFDCQLGSRASRNGMGKLPEAR